MIIWKEEDQNNLREIRKDGKKMANGKRKCSIACERKDNFSKTPASTK